MIFVDMDDVLSSWNTVFEKYNKKWININGVDNKAEIFLELNPNKEMINAMKKLKNQGYPICILTAVSNEYKQYDEICHYKKEWIKNYMPFINVETELMCVKIEDDQIAAVEKVRKAKEITGHNLKLHDEDILIDDGLKNVIKWHEAGGRAFQFITYTHYQVPGEFEWLTQILPKTNAEGIVNLLLRNQNDDDFF